MRLRSLRRVIGRRVRLNLDSAALDGVLTHVSRSVFVLAGVRIPQAGRGADEGIPVDGTVVVDRSRVAFVQVEP